MDTLHENMGASRACLTNYLSGRRTVRAHAAGKNETHVVWPTHTSASVKAFEIIK